ncbi:murein biosynthesis integral membrane protein MurJ [Spiractinospora alimapuensis]|uniref:murein biosynthesis integral membrane protein MurJ n=1 Tax=Spiractinospora alimapuensis TaxID=2820884 RepID=UPI001F2D135B|nr:murein biosynthesis integral membrane protein MurJ [Spiractinospora alimapuensis]
MSEVNSGQRDERVLQRVPSPEEVLDAVERSEPASQADTGLRTTHDPTDFGDAGTADRPGEEGDEIGGAAHTARGPNLFRTSAFMAVGTVFSRGTGFLRTIMLAAALGTHLLGDAYYTANSVAFIVNDLLIGGLLASVFVPFLVKRRKADPDGGNATEQRLFTTGLLALLLITVGAILCAELLIRLYASEFGPQQHEVAVYLARFLLAQIFFIGGSGIVSAMLNARGHLIAPMWAPVMNNLTIIAVAVMFIVVAGTNSTPETITGSQIALLGIGTTLGQVIQAAILMFALWRAGFSWRPRLDLRGSGMGEAMRAASWMMMYIGIAQVGMLISTNVANAAGVRAAAEGDAAGAGITAYKYAFLLFQLPYAIIAVTVITALLPRLSAHVADGRKDLVRSDFSRGFRLSATLIIPISMALVVFSVPLCVLVYAQGSTSLDDAAMIGKILRIFSLMLIPFTLFQLLQRIFYALGDTRSPAFIAIPAELAHGVTSFALLFLVPPQQVVLWLPVTYGLYYVIGSIFAWTILNKRLDGLDGKRTLRTILLLYVACVPSMIFGAAMQLTFDVIFPPTLSAIAALAIGGGIGAMLFILVARMLKVTEVTTIVQVARTRVLRRR